MYKVIRFNDFSFLAYSPPPDIPPIVAPLQK